jgi:uncharacterized protein (TIGR00661 family)
MARILYGVSGEGFGHATRAKEIVSYLQSAGHQVQLVSYDKGFDLLSQFFPVERISGLRLSYADNEVKYLATIGHTLLKSKSSIESVDKVKTLVKEFKPDLVITDFEPTVNFVANLLRLPLISLDNQHLITKTDIEIPEAWYSDYIITKLVVRFMVFNPKRYLVLSFFDCQALDNKTIVVKPVVRQEVLKLRPSNGDYILVYLTSEFDKIIPLLEASGHKYIVYGLSRANAGSRIIFKPLGSADFLTDLESCQGIIATAGFSLISEALYLHKPILALPIKSQFEQYLNAYYLAKLGYGLMSLELSMPDLELFRSSLDLYRANLASYQQQDNSELFTVLENCLKELVKQD